jgi:hypothetical protein
MRTKIRLGENREKVFTETAKMADMTYDDMVELYEYYEAGKFTAKKKEVPIPTRKSTHKG